ncbi:MAG: leucine-rich repeat protein [Anaerovoracaceae bacterium]|jgi:hypothetical protein
MIHVESRRAGSLSAVILAFIVVIAMIWSDGMVVNAGGANYYTDTSTKLTFNLDDDGTASLVDIDSSLTDVVVPSTVTKDGVTYTVDEAWAKKYKSSGQTKYANVTSIQFPSTVKLVENFTLPNVTSLTFPSSVKTIDHIQADNATTVNFSGSLDKINTIKFPKATSFQFPDVREIKGRITLSEMEELTIPDSVEKFTATFSNTKKLKKLTMGAHEISESGSLFWNCPAVEEVTFTPSVKKIGKSGLFSRMASLTKVSFPDDVICDKNNINSMFYGCTGLEELNLPAGVTPDGQVGYQMFYGCTNLKKISFGTQLTSIGYAAFQNCSALEEAPDLSQVTEMKTSQGYSYAFSGCTSMTGDIDLSSLNSIPASAFTKAAITGVKFSPELTSIGYYAFQQTKLKSVDIPDSVTSIGAYAFWNIGSLKTLKIGDGVKTLDNAVFRYCYGLKEIEIGSGITEIADSVFDSCSAVEKAVIHSSEDAVEVNDIGSLPHDQIIFTEPSIGDVGDTIGGDGPDEDWSLQKAVNEANDGGTVVIHKHVLLSDTLTIPDGKEVTIKSAEDADGNYYAIWAAKNAALDDGKLITVGEGQTLNLEDVTVRGFRAAVGQNSGLLNISGTLNLKNDAVIKDTKLRNKDSAAIRVDGENAVLTMTDGSKVTGNDRSAGTAEATAPIRVTNGAAFDMSGGEITGNTSVDSNHSQAIFCSAGAYLDNGGKMNMTGGTISGNTAHCGSAVFVRGDNSSLVIDGENALISGNQCVDNVDHLSCGGTVCAEDGGSITLKNGILEGNESCYVGGAVAIGRTGKFTMDGGTVSNNSAKGYGGGLYLYGTDLHLNAGSITGNKAGTGGGVYVEGNLGSNYATAHKATAYFKRNTNNTYATAYFQNTLIKDNSAASLGGGIWACATGRLDLQANSAAVYDNKAAAASAEQSAAGDDFALVRPKDKSLIVPTPENNSVSERQLGGGAVRYYTDGGVKANYQPTDTARDWGSPTGLARYSTESLQQHVDNDDSHNFALKSVVDNEDVKTLAESKAKLVISGNSADRGGGVGANGGLVFSGGGDKKILVEKNWNGGDPAVDSIKVGVYSDGNKIETVTLDKDHAWKAELTDLPEDLGSITAKEETSVAGFSSEVKVTENSTGDYAVTITVSNTRVEKPESVHDKLTINKVDENEKALNGAVFTLYADADCTQKIADYKTENGQTVINTEDAALAGHLPAAGSEKTLYLKETTAPEGYETDDTVHEIKLTAKSESAWNGDHSAYVTTTIYEISCEEKDTLTIADTPHKEEVTVHDSLTVRKVDSNGTALNGAVFTLYADAGCKKKIADYKVRNGKVVISTDDAALADYLPAAGAKKTLYLKETTAPKGYQTDDTVYKVRVSATEKSGWNEDHSAYVTTTVYSIRSNRSDTLRIVNSKVSKNDTINKTNKNGSKKKGNPSNPSGRDSSLGHAARTGDTMPLSWLLLLMFAGLALFGIIFARHHRASSDRK